MDNTHDQQNNTTIMEFVAKWLAVVLPKLTSLQFFSFGPLLPSCLSIIIRPQPLPSSSSSSSSSFYLPSSLSRLHLQLLDCTKYQAVTYGLEKLQSHTNSTNRRVSLSIYVAGERFFHSQTKLPTGQQKTVKKTKTKIKKMKDNNNNRSISLDSTSSSLSSSSSSSHDHPSDSSDSDSDDDANSQDDLSMAVDPDLEFSEDENID
jgi:hypothetical protein